MSGNSQYGKIYRFPNGNPCVANEFVLKLNCTIDQVQSIDGVDSPNPFPYSWSLENDTLTISDFFKKTSDVLIISVKTSQKPKVSKATWICSDGNHDIPQPWLDLNHY